MADTKISALTAATAAAGANELPINEAGTSKKITVDQVTDFCCTRAAGTTVAAGPHTTWLVLAANNGDVTGTTLTTQMTMTGVGVGRYAFFCQLIYQTTASTTGIDVAVNHTGTTTQFLAEARSTGTLNTATDAIASALSTNAAGSAYNSQATRTKNAIIGAGTIGTVAGDVNLDLLHTIAGFFVVSVTGSLEIKLAAESAALVCRAMQGSFLELKKLS